YLEPYGGIVDGEWLRTPQVRPEISLDEYVIMPNHFHAIVLISSESRVAAPDARLGQAPTEHTGRAPRSLGSLVAGFKATTTRRRGTPGMPFWQRNYYEHVMRDDRDLNRIRSYIQTNPLRWAEDEYNPAR